MSDERFRILFENSLDAMVLADDYGRHLDVNQAACDLFGYSREQMLTMRVGDLMPLQSPGAAERHQVYLQSGRETGEFSFMRADGEVRHASYSACLLMPGQHLSVLRDITAHKAAETQPLARYAAIAADNARLHVASQKEIEERQRTEAALGVSQAQLRLITSAVPLLISYVDREQRFRFNNQTYTDWFKRPLEAITGRHVREVLGKAAYEGLRAYIEAALSGQTVSFEHEMPYQGTHHRYVQITFVPDKGENAEVKGFVAVVNDLTGRNQAEQALAASETRFRMLVEQSPLSIQILSPKGRTLQVNRAWEQLWGLTLDDLRDYNMLEDQQLAAKGILPYIQRAFAGEAGSIPPVLYDTEQTLPNRTQLPDPRRWTQAYIYPVKNNQGNIREVVLIHEDITERIEASKARAYLAAIIHSSEDAIVSKDLDGIVTSWNPAAERIYGYTAEEIIGKSKSLVIPPELPDELPTILRKIRAGERIEPYETIRIRKDGSRVNLSTTVSPVLDVTGQIIGASTIAHDITEQIRAEEEHARLMVEVAHERKRMDDLVSSIPGVVWEAWGEPDKTDQRINFVSDYVETMLGYTVSEWLTTPNFWLTIVHPEDREQAGRIAAETWIRGGQHTNAFRWISKDGRVLWCESYSVVIQDESGASRGMRGVTLDVSARKQAEVERDQHIAEIEGLNARLRRSVQETHHRVKNNLQIVAALAEMQMEDDSATVPGAALKRISQHTRSLAAIHDLLTMQSKIDVEADTISTKATIDKLIPLLQATADGRRICCKAEAILLAVQQIGSLCLLVNELVSNAVKHGEGDIDISLMSRGSLARLEVCNDGPGFPPDFDPHKAANTGLNLIDATGRYDLHGTISYENRPEGGARVRVEFPIPHTAAPAVKERI